MFDSRRLCNGNVIPTEGYCDQPYLIVADDGAWICAVTTGSEREGEPGQRIVVMRSHDRGASWSDGVCLEPADGPEASYSVLLKTPTGRIYCFYNHNSHNVRSVRRGDGKPQRRVDLLGVYVFRFSDDHGLTWSSSRYPVPIRQFDCDLNSAHAGEIMQFWNTGRPTVCDGRVIIPIHKIGNVQHAGRLIHGSEGAFLRSDNLLAEADPLRIRWETLPTGSVGLGSPGGGGRIAEEHSVVTLSDGSLHTVYRTVDGYPAHAYSRDGGETWSDPEYMRYDSDGARIKHPRAANFHWRCGNGKYLYWYHNHGGAFVKEGLPGVNPYADRNPAWLCAGIEHDSPSGKVLHWSQPEIVLYDDDVAVRTSYPDLLEENGKYFISETQKSVARVHELDADLIDGLFSQKDGRALVTTDLLIDLVSPFGGDRPSPACPALPSFEHSGLTIDLTITFPTLSPNEILLDNRTAAGRGFALVTTGRGTVEIILNDGRSESRWDCDRGVLRQGMRHRLTVTVEPGPRVITFVVDGLLCDGGEDRQFGWGRFNRQLRDVNGEPMFHTGSPTVHQLRMYGRALRTSETIRNG